MAFPKKKPTITDRPMDPPPDDNAARDRRVLLDLIDEFRADHAIVVANLKAENWRLIQKAERDAPPEIWWPLPKACVIDGNRTERQRATDHENMRRRCANHSIIAEKRGPDRGLWWVRMEGDLDGRMTPMLRK
jgi:hypothetical protein